MENEVIITDNFSIESWTNGSKEKAISGVDAKRVDRVIYSIDPDKLTVLPDFNPRIETEALRARVRYIADSIKANGFYQHKPIACIVLKQNGQDIIVPYDGHTRLKGAKLARSEGYLLETVYICVAPAGTTQEDVTTGFVTNNTDCRLEPMEIGFICKRMQGFGLDNTTIAKRLGFSVAYIGQLFELIGADRKIRDLVNDGKISATLAVDTIRNEGESAVKVLTEAVEVAQSQGKDKATKKHLKATDKAPKASVDKPASSPIVAPVLQTVQATPEPFNTPFNALIAAEAVSHSEAVMLEKGINWLKGNIGIIDQSHYELMQALFPGSTMESLMELVE